MNEMIYRRSVSFNSSYRFPDNWLGNTYYNVPLTDSLSSFLITQMILFWQLLIAIELKWG